MFVKNLLGGRLRKQARRACIAQCRTEALRLVGRTDEATITLESLTAQTLTPRQRRRLEKLRAALEPA